MARSIVMVLRAGRPEHAPESEPVVIDVSGDGGAELWLDDGERLIFDAAELRAALEAPRATREAA